MSDSVQHQRRQPTGLPHPWYFPGKNTGVGCHFLFQCMKVKNESEIAQLCLTLCDLMDCSLSGSSVYGIFQARLLEWGAIAFSVRIETRGGHGNPHHDSCLENPVDRGAWWATACGVAKSRTRLSDFTFTFHFHALEKEMATHSSVLA